MSDRNVHLVLLCEDKLQQTLVRRFLVRRLRFRDDVIEPVALPVGRQSGEQFVRQRFPVELKAYRSRRGKRKSALIVVTDGDNIGVAARRKTLEAAVKSAGLDPPSRDEAVVVLIPTWSIETWIRDLQGIRVGEDRSHKPDIDESKLDRPALLQAAGGRFEAFSQGRPADCVPSLADAAEQMARLLELAT